MEKLVKRLDDLIDQGDKLKELSRDIGSQVDQEREEYGMLREQWIRSCENFFEFSNMIKFLDQFKITEKNRSYDAYKTSQLIGILKSAKDEINAGLVSKIKYLIHADFYDHIVDQAENLLNNGYKIPSAVLGRIVIERWLRDEAEKAEIQANEKDNASAINDKLKKIDLFSIPKWRQVQSFLDIGNSAAHGKEREFSDDDVKRMHEFIRLNCF